MNKFEIRTQKKKDAILRAALALFRAKGYTNTGMQEIASAAEVSAVSIYNYFGSKENLARSCAALLLSDTNAMIDDLLREPLPFEEKLLKAVSICSEKPHELFEAAFSPAALEDVVFVELLSESVNDARLGVLSTFIEEGKAEGAIDPALSTETILGFLGAILAAQSNWTTASEHKEQSKALYHLALYGLVGR